MHQVPNNHCSLRRHLLVFLSWLNTTRRRTAAFLFVCIGAYVLFRLTRPHLPRGYFRSSFPSFLVIPFMFSIVDLVPGIRFHSRRSRIIILTLTTVVLALWFEVVVPAFHPSSIGDITDTAAMFVGLIFYFAASPSIFCRHMHFSLQPRSNHAMQLTGSARHGSCSPQTRRAATAPRSACSWSCSR